MRDGEESLGNSAGRPMSHRRILILMAILGIAGSIAGTVLFDLRTGLGVLLGTALAFASYYWLKHSLRKVFDTTAEGERPRLSVIKYIARYFTLGFAIALIYATGVVPIIAVLLGMAGFGFAVMADGLIQIFTSFSNRKEL